MRKNWENIRHFSAKRKKSSRFVLMVLLSGILTACAQSPLTVYEPALRGEESIAILELHDSAMSFEEVTGFQVSGEEIHRTNVPMAVRSLKVLPGSYQVSLVYEHLGQPKCWVDGTSTHCWKVRDRGWWLPGATLIPATIEWSPEAGKTYTVTRSGSYWSMTAQPSWNAMISAAERS